MHNSLHIPQSQIVLQSSKVLAPLIYGENALGVCYPTCKIGYLLERLLNDPISLKTYVPNADTYLLPVVYLQEVDTVKTVMQKIVKSINIQYRSLNVHNIDSVYSLSEYAHSMGKKLHIFYLDTHFLNVQTLKDLFYTVHDEVTRSTIIQASFFIEKNIHTEPFASIFSTHTKFQQNISLFPAYSAEDSKIFADNLCNMWEIQPDKDLLHWVLDEFGGFLWFMREAIRQIRDAQTPITREEILNSSPIRLRFATLSNLLSPAEMNLLSNIHQQKLISPEQRQSSEFRYLSDIKIIVENGNGFVIRPSSLYKMHHEASEGVQLGNEHTLPGDTPFDIFTKQEEKVMKLLLENKNKIVSREQIAQIMWGEQDWNEKYSDWAIDKIISRIRQVLDEQGISSLTLITKKGRGFLIQ